jgi:hypothetical protein
MLLILCVLMMGARGEFWRLVWLVFEEGISEFDSFI